MCKEMRSSFILRLLTCNATASNICQHPTLPDIMIENPRSVAIIDEKGSGKSATLELLLRTQVLDNDGSIPNVVVVQCHADEARFHVTGRHGVLITSRGLLYRKGGSGHLGKGRNANPAFNSSTSQTDRRTNGR